MSAVPDVSVIVTLHREGRFVRPALRSLGAAVAHAAAHGIATEVVMVLDRPDGRTRAHVAEVLGATTLLAAAVGTEFVEVDNGDAGPSRNDGVRAARGAVLATYDGDDMTSENWLTASVDLVRRHPGPVVVHPAYVLSFGALVELWPIVGSDAEVFAPWALAVGNPWPSRAVAPREVFETHPYGSSGGEGAFGAEDWHWNCETVGAGVPHLTAPRTVHYWRRKPARLSRAESQRHSLLAPAEVLRDKAVAAATVRGASSASPQAVLEGVVAAGLEGFATPDGRRDGVVDTTWAVDALGVDADGLAALEPARFNVGHYRVLHLDVGHLPYAELVAHYLTAGLAEGRAGVLSAADEQALVSVGFSAQDYLAAHADLAGLPSRAVIYHYLAMGRAEGRAVRAPQAEAAYPPLDFDEGIVRDWRQAHETDPTLVFPTADLLQRLPVVWSPSFKLGGAAAAYWQIVDRLPERVDAVFIVPWVVMGGADRLLLHYLDAIRRHRPEWNVAVLTTLGGRSTRLGTIPDGVTAVDVGEVFDAHGVGYVERIKVLADLLVQYGPALTHTINAEIVLDLLDLYGATVRRRTNVFLSTFSVVKSHHGEVYAPFVTRSEDILDNVAGVITDNHAVIERLHDLGGLDREKFHVHHQPAPALDVARRDVVSSATKFLWAGRFDQEKRLDVVADIAARLRATGSPAVIHVYGTTVLDNADTAGLLDRLRASGVVVHPPYDGFTSLPLDEFAGVLLTSDMEGVPIILLEAAAAGLALVAPQVGGVPEVVRPETGWPVSRTEAIDEYVTAIGSILTDREEALVRIKAAWAMIDDEFSQAGFDRRLLATPGYLS